MHMRKKLSKVFIKILESAQHTNHALSVSSLLLLYTRLLKSDFDWEANRVAITAEMTRLKVTVQVTRSCVLLTWALNSSVSLGGSFFESPATLPRRMSLTETFFTLKPTLSPGEARSSAVWCISTDFTSVVTFTGANVTIIPAFRVPVSTRPTGTVPIPDDIHDLTADRA